MVPTGVRYRWCYDRKMCHSSRCFDMINDRFCAVRAARKALCILSLAMLMELIRLMESLEEILDLIRKHLESVQNLRFMLDNEKPLPVSCDCRLYVLRK